MRRFSAILVMIIVLILLHYYNQSVLPRRVEEEFKAQYPLVQEYQWKSNIGEYEFEFYLDERRQLALLNRKGDLLRLSSEINPNQVPALVLDSLDKTYSDFSIESANKIKISDSTVYELQIMREHRGWDLFYADNGNLLEKEKTFKVGKKDMMH